MKDLIKPFLILVAGGILAIAGSVSSALFQVAESPVLSGVPYGPSYNSASSTTYAIGPDLSTEVLSQKGGRGYALFCNGGDNKAYLEFGSTAISATTSADVQIDPDECYEINRDNLYVGVVQALQETSTSTTFIVTELRGN